MDAPWSVIAYDGHGSLRGVCPRPDIGWLTSARHEPLVHSVDHPLSPRRGGRNPDRLVSITTPAQATTSFGFDALGRHLSRTLPGSVVEAYAYVGTSETAWRIDDGAAPIRATLDPTGARVAIEDDGIDGFALPDLHGNTAAVVNAADAMWRSCGVSGDPNFAPGRLIQCLKGLEREL